MERIPQSCISYGDPIAGAETNRRIPFRLGGKHQSPNPSHLSNEDSAIKTLLYNDGTDPYGAGR